LQRLPNLLPALHVHQAAWKARVPRDLGSGWDFDDVRDHYVERLYGERAEAVRHSDPARHRALGRVVSGEAMARAFMQWRCAGSRCGGALVWLLRDLWPGAGWGVLDDACRPKAAFHALARVLQPVHLGITDDGLDGLSLHLVNERPDAIEAELEFVLYRDAEVAVAQWRRPLRLAPRSCRRIAATDGLEGFVDLNWVYRFGPPAGDIAVATLVERRGDGRRVELAQAFHRVVDGPLPRCSDIGLRAQARPMADGRIKVEIESRGLAWGVHFDAPGWRPEDEFFHVAPGGCRTVNFVPVASRQRAWRSSISALNGQSTAIALLAQ
jgi:beta-mannosidase